MSDTYLIPQFIIDYLQKSKSTKNPQKLASASLKKNKTPEIEKWFKENEVTAGYLWKFFVFYGLDRFSFRECPECGKRIDMKIVSKYPNTKYCSTKCANSSEEKKEKRKQTNLERYDVEYPIQSKSVQEKHKHTCLKRYGVDSFSKTQEYKEKFKQTSLERYGVENPIQSKEVQEKRKETCKEKYGVEYPAQAIKVKEKFKEQRRLNHWQTFCSLLKEKNIVSLFSEEEYIKDTGRRFKCLICGKEFESEGTCDYDKEHPNDDSTYRTLSICHLYCPHCFKARYSKKEKEVAEFVKSIYSGEILENDRKILEGKELDIYLPQLNLGIEFDGDYWHSKEGAQERDERKNQLCEEKGIHLIRIKEEDWDTDKEKVKEEIKKYIL